MVKKALLDLHIANGFGNFSRLRLEIDGEHEHGAVKKAHQNSDNCHKPDETGHRYSFLAGRLLREASYHGVAENFVCCQGEMAAARGCHQNF